MQPGKMAYVVMRNDGTPCFSGDTFERAAERVSALMHGETMGDACVVEAMYRIVRVEAE